jgi:hypothetical protein
MACTTTEEILQALNRTKTPEYMHGGIVRYLVNKIAPGSFLTAVICNDLRRACENADATNATLLIEYVKFFYNDAPSQSWGSREKFDAWMAEPQYVVSAGEHLRGGV